MLNKLINVFINKPATNDLVFCFFRKSNPGF